MLDNLLEAEGNFFFETLKCLEIVHIFHTSMKIEQAYL